MAPPPRGRRPVATAVSAAALQALLASRLQLGGACGSTQSAALSLAQRLGLVAGPPPKLSPADWLQVQLQSRVRGDSVGECAICCRSFRAEGQVLLSCSHTFHQACLASWERFCGGQRHCPLCRCAAYEKRRIEDAVLLWRAACATCIQAAWRGWLARRHHAALRRLLPPQHPALRRRWCADRLEEGSAALVGSVERGAAEVDALFAELDATRTATRGVFSALSQRCGRAAAQAGAAGAAAGQAPALLVGQPSASPAAQDDGGSGRSGCSSPGQTAPAAPAAFDWVAVLDRCLQRDEEPECPICLAPLGQLCSPAAAAAGASAACDGGASSARASHGSKGHHRPHASGSSSSSNSSSNSGSIGTAGSRSLGGLAVCSCTHAFHADCLSAFEAFVVASDLTAACPVCRSAYQRLDLR